MTCPTWYKACIEDADLKPFVAAEWVSAECIQETSEEHIIFWINRRCMKDKMGEYHFLIHAAFIFVAMNMKIPEAEDGVWSLHRNYSLNLGYS